MMAMTEEDRAAAFRAKHGRDPMRIGADGFWDEVCPEGYQELQEQGFDLDYVTMNGVVVGNYDGGSASSFKGRGRCEFILLADECAGRVCVAVWEGEYGPKGAMSRDDMRIVTLEGDVLIHLRSIPKVMAA